MTIYGLLDGVREAYLNTLRTGYYDLAGGYINYRRTMAGIWWSGTSASTTGSHDLNTWQTGYESQTANSRGTGLAIRCVVREG